MADGKKNNGGGTTGADRLTALLGYDPGKGVGITKDAFQSVLDDLQKERSDESRAKAKELLKKAIELRKQQHALRVEFVKKDAAADKELNKLVNQLESAVNGTPPPAAAEEAPAEEAPAA